MHVLITCIIYEKDSNGYHAEILTEEYPSPTAAERICYSSDKTNSFGQVRHFLLMKDRKSYIYVISNKKNIECMTGL